MTQVPRLEVRPRPGRNEAPGFEERLYESLQATPWWLASVGAHLVLGLVLAVFIREEPYDANPPSTVTAEMSTDWTREEEYLPPDVKETPPIDHPDVPTVVDLRDIPVSEVSVTENETDSMETLGEQDYASESPFRGPGVNGEIGTGGGAGGPGRGNGGPRNLRIGASVETLKATDAALEWLRNHQSPGGFWDADGFEARCKGNKCGGPGGPLHDVGVTGLALLPFLGAGETHKSEKHGRVVRDGLKYLRSVQDAEGCFGPQTGHQFIYDHATAALAMTEAYGMTQSPLFKTPAQNAVDFVHKAQNPYAAWRYGVRPQDNDTSVTGWMVMVLKSAKMADLRVDPASFDYAVAFLDKVTEPEYGRAGYTARGNGPARPQELMDRFPADKSESMTAVAVLARIFCGQRPDDPLVRKGAELVARMPPVFDEAAGTVDHYYWYYGTLAMFQVGGDSWKRWEAGLKTAILGTQRSDKSDHRYGSWDPVGPWGPEGGRVYSTALNALNLEVYYRYGRVFGAR